MEGYQDQPPARCPFRRHYYIRDAVCCQRRHQSTHDQWSHLQVRGPEVITITCDHDTSENPNSVPTCSIVIVSSEISKTTQQDGEFVMLT